MDANISDAQVQAAYDHTIGNVFQPVFFERLKRAGLAPRTQSEAVDALRLGAILYADHQQKEAARLEKSGSIYARVLADIDGGRDQAGPGNLDHHAKQAAITLLGRDNGELAASVAILAELSGAY